MCASWYDYLSDRVHQEEEINLDQANQSRQVLSEIVQEEVRILNDPQKVILVGFSQGATMVLDVGLSYPQVLGAVIVRRGHLMSCTELNQSKRQLPISAYHGTKDDGIGFDVAKTSYQRFTQSNFAAMEFNQEEGLNHTAYSETEMQAFANFLFVHFPTVRCQSTGSCSSCRRER
jgi:predicted esterase